MRHDVVPLIILTGWAVAMTGQLPAATGNRSDDRPNIILIFTDDQGYNDLGCFGSPNIRTPNIDQMARSGMRFTDFYSAASVCTPSRAALLTGCYPERVGNLPVLFPDSLRGLNPAETTIAELLKAAGYSTACIGKWHLGHHPEMLPTQHGFDQYFGVPYSNDMGVDAVMKLSDEAVFREGQSATSFKMDTGRLPPLMRGTEVIEWPADQTRLTERYTQEAVEFIRANSEKPFFLYLPHTMPHIPLYVSDRFRGKSQIGLYGDALEEIDWSVGQILETLRRQGIEDNTLVIYTSDNGPWDLKGNKTDKVAGNLNRSIGGSAYPLTGFKFSTWEGGMRVPCVVQWPERVPAGSTCREVVGTIDLLPTLASLAGAKLPALEIDGKNIGGLLRGDAQAESPHQAYFFRTEGVRSGRWKLLNDKLYDLEQNIGESRDLASEQPEVFAKLKDLLVRHRSEMSRVGRPPAYHQRDPYSLPADDRWTVESGNWVVNLQQGVLRQKADWTKATVSTGPLDQSVCQLDLEAKLLDDGSGYQLALSDWNQKQVLVKLQQDGTLSLAAGQLQGSHQQAVADVKQWHRLTIRIHGETISVAVNGDEKVKLQLAARFPASRLSIESNQSRVAFRNVRVKDADNKSLLESFLQKQPNPPGDGKQN